MATSEKEQLGQSIVASIIEVRAKLENVRSAMKTLNALAPSTTEFKELKRFEDKLMQMAAEVSRWPI